jgi:RecA/RadA recombinase
MAKSRTQLHASKKQLPKAPTGIQGLDEITSGGLPKGRPTLVCGSAGCGKTLLAMEFLVRGARQFDEPGGSGIEVLQSIKKDRPDIKVIVFTNYPYPQYRKKCMELGADFFFAKATESEQIPVIVSELIQGSRD